MKSKALLKWYEELNEMEDTLNSLISRAIEMRHELMDIRTELIVQIDRSEL